MHNSVISIRHNVINRPQNFLRVANLVWERPGINDNWWQVKLLNLYVSCDSYTILSYSSSAGMVKIAYII